eukprot:TRINITY_DN7541_c0_g1_i5.p1 TRINITY_DN7541_c0_g1~~TRINITY_DN7541_c0_g1_i5.p1  ORF type:complete len:712 (-),score=100.05 TRINITY_DN7541_c0_g1_i5:8-2074(-)
MGSQPRAEGFPVTLDAADVAQGFEQHLHGLVLAFQHMQKRYHDLLHGCSDQPEDIEVHRLVQLPAGMQGKYTESTALDVSTVSKSPSGNLQVSQDSKTSPGNSQSLDSPVMSMYRLIGQDENSPAQTFPASEENQEQTEVFADDSLRKQLQSHFHRLDSSRSGTLEFQEIRGMMNSLYDNWELESWADVVYHLTKLTEAPEDARQESSRPVFRKSSTTLMKASGGEGINLEMFIFLRTASKEVLQKLVPSSVQRDLTQLQEAFEKENEQALYASDNHLTPELSHRGYKGNEAFFADVVPACVICLNVVTIGISSDIEPGSPVWQILEYAFLGFYFLEFVVKIRVFSCHWYFKGPERVWNIFDFLCLLLSFVDAVLSSLILLAPGSETTVNLEGLMLLKIIRTSRLFRLIRTLRYEVFTELKTMVLGVASGMRCLAWSWVLLFILIYIFGIAASQLFGGSEPEFATVPAAMFTLFRCCTEGCAAYDGTPLTERLREKHGVVFTVPYLFIFFGISLGVFNLVTAVFIDNVMVDQEWRKQGEIYSTTNHYEVRIKEQMIRLILQNSQNGVPEEVEEEINSLTLQNYAARIRAQYSILENSDVVISRPSFTAMLSDPTFIKLLVGASIETSNVAALFDVLDADLSGWLSVGEVYHGLMRLRGPICKSEIVGIRLRCRHMTQAMHATESTGLT